MGSRVVYSYVRKGFRTGDAIKKLRWIMMKRKTNKDTFRVYETLLNMNDVFPNEVSNMCQFQCVINTLNHTYTVQ